MTNTPEQPNPDMAAIQAEIQQSLADFKETIPDNDEQAIIQQALVGLEKTIQDIGVKVIELKNFLNIAHGITHLFDLNQLRAEGITNLETLDMKYHVVVGSQFMVDYHKAIADYNEIVASYATLQNCSSILALESTTERLSNLMDQALTLQLMIGNWVSSFGMVQYTAAKDLIDNLNRSRPADKQLINHYEHYNTGVITNV